MTYELRRAERSEGAAIVQIWRAGWSHAHCGHVEPRLIAARSQAFFLERIRRHLDCDAVAVTVAVHDDRVAGFVIVVDDEVEQLYVAADHRGTECAALLLRAAESQIAEAGMLVAWLAVVAGNTRARRFYSKLGWVDRGPFIYSATGRAGTEDRIPVEAHRYEKPVTP